MAHARLRWFDSDRHHQVGWVYLAYRAPKYKRSISYALKNGTGDKFFKCVTGMAVKEYFCRWRWSIIELARKGPCKGHYKTPSVYSINYER